MQIDDKIYLTKEELEDYKMSIDNLLINLGRITQNIIDLRNDNPRSKKIDELLYFKEGIKNKISQKKDNLNKIIIVEKSDKSNYADIGDVIKVNTYYPEGTLEEVYELVLGDTDFDTIPEKISIESPKGKAIYKTNIGDSKYFRIGNNKIKIEVLEKVNVKKLVKDI